MNRFLYFPVATGMILLLNCPLLGSDTPRKSRSFRPIVPIKQNVRSGPEASKEQTISVQIAPPPIPEPGPSNALFPNALIAEIDLPPSPDEKDSSEEVEEILVTDLVGSPPKEFDPDAPTLSKLRQEAHALASKGLTYKFGADDPKQGGMDCSATMQYLFEKIGIDGVPRTSYDQYYWLKKKKRLDDVYGKNASEKLLKKLAPGDLIFWGGTWKSGHRVSHVMLYMGYDDKSDKHYVFGARGKSSKGITGNGVDVFELDLDRGKLIGHGKVPGLVYD